jgi:hypothetical protein
MIDRWTLVHYLAWFAPGATYKWLGVPLLLGLLITLAGALIWEVFEAYAENKDWVSGDEDWKNRWVSDPVVSLLGAVTGYLWVAW